MFERNGKTAAIPDDKLHSDHAGEFRSGFYNSGWRVLLHTLLQFLRLHLTLTGHLTEQGL